MKYILLKSFVKKFDFYKRPEQEAIISKIEDIKNYLENNKAPYGLRIKKLSSKIFEARINIHLRIAFFRDKGVVKLFCLGNHDDIKRCLKRLKQLLKVKTGEVKDLPQRAQSSQRGWRS
ncbi:MAG: hypothetical protein KAI43_11515 [Candidatus Aureabacteria bacterium]|nr:hypothetical protein [Candidatus Auribacterota bacterium]